jgi:hypothetical protein
MSTKTTPITQVELDTTEVTYSPSTDVVSSNLHDVTFKEIDSVVEGYKAEYSIVGDGLYASISADDAPQWLTEIIDSVVKLAVDRGMINYDLLVQDVRNAIDSIDVAKNQYVEKINIDATIDSVIASRLTTLNATYEATYATKVGLTTAVATSESALLQEINDLRASLNDSIDSRITSTTTAYTTADEALASDITALTTIFTNQEESVQATAEAITSLQTYIGLTSDYNPTGEGLINEIETKLGNILATVELLEKQNDGVTETYAGLHDILVHDTDPNDGIDTTSLRTDQWPYALWTPMFGTVDPTGTTRTAYKNTVAEEFPIPDFTIYKNTSAGTFWRYLATTGGWGEITEEEYNSTYDVVRANHVGDIFIYYEEVNGQKIYLESYKFIQGEIDTTPPYLTDSEGFSWAVVTDTAAQQAYIQALNAYALADGKLSQFYAWGGTSIPADYTFVNSEGVNETVPGSNYSYWFRNGNLNRKTSTGTWVALTLADKVFYDGDIVTVFDPITRDYTNYSYSAASNVWAQLGTKGIISKSQYIIDLENEVVGPTGHVATALSELETSSTAYANAIGAEVEAKFEYNSTVSIGGYYYTAGFGLVTTGVTQPPSATGTSNNPFTSEFWIDAEKFKFTNTSKSLDIAPFSIDTSGDIPQIKFNGIVNFDNYDNTVYYNDLLNSPTHDVGYSEPSDVAVDGSTYTQITLEQDIVWIYNNGWKKTIDELALYASDLGINGTTTIHGGRIETGTLSADSVYGGAFFAKNLSTAAVPSYYTGTVMDSKGVRVYNNGVLRVKLGNLA